MIEYCSDDLETSQELPEQYSIVGRGAQYIVGMLTGPEQGEVFTVWGNEEPAPRVLKVPLPRSYVSLAVDGMHIEYVDREEKVESLIQSRQLHSMLITVACLHDESLYRLTGRPHQAVSPGLIHEPSQIAPMTLYDEDDNEFTFRRFYPSYSQDYSPSMTPIIQSEPREPNGERLRTLIDEYAQVQRFLITRGLFDNIFKLDNYGYTPDGIVIHDFSELTLDVDSLAVAIRTKKWERITENKEYTQLTPNMQDYFNDRMEKALPKSVISTWNSYAFGLASRLLLPDIIPAKTIEKIMDQL
jgi:hypothetical protein